MRWIDIILPEPATHRKLDSLMAKASSQLDGLELIQQRDGLDNITVVEQMAKVGRLLFQGVTAVDSEAFHPASVQGGCSVPPLADKEHDELVGYHLVVPPCWTHLPWNWLHNGVGFLLGKNPIVTSGLVSSLPAGALLRPWMQRCRRAEFLVDDEGANNLAGILDQLRPHDQSAPEFLFVPGHTEERIRRMIYREGEAITSALDGTNLARPLAKVQIPHNPITPGQLSGMSLTYQALHFAGPVSYAATGSEEDQPDWMDQLAEDLNAPADGVLESTFGLEGEVLGVDPITSLLDDVCDRYDQEQLAGHHSYQEDALQMGGRNIAGHGQPGEEGNRNGASSPWLLDDGPVEPESLGRAGGVPPLVYSNSYRALPQLGQRFIDAGASTFIGPVVPLFSRPARIFSGYCYQALGEGWCAGAAVWKAAQNCRRELGEEHPAWLSYGVHGYGTLALQYL